MTAVAKITKTKVDELVAYDDRPVFLWEVGLPGFGIKCTRQGTKTYVVKYRVGAGGRSARQRWITLGRHGRLTPDQARKLAREVLVAACKGEDPQGEKMSQRGEMRLSDLWSRYERDHIRQLKPQSRREYERKWEKLLRPSFGVKRVSEITRSDVDKFHKQLRETPYQANRALALLSRLMNLAEVWEYRPTGSNPCRHVEKFSEKARTRYLTASELGKLGQGLKALPKEGKISRAAANAIRLLLFTGARLNEILALEWSWIDLKARVINLPDSKTGAKPIFLNDAAVSVLEDERKFSFDSKYAFPGEGSSGRMVNLRKPWTKLCTYAEIDGVRLHDLRHTVASVAVGQGASLPVIGRLLGHSQAQTTQRYAHVDADPALLASDAVGKAISSALTDGDRSSSTT
ncbi:tyrosine-type recombinase/integrase [Aurantiacibacter zhengii]|uniref:DUF4102 domain-containing protein n=1 Tax=Aurantiacibacter zhengii TaxID=2307003 RepID=A0A418NS80_9SPHN|nr:site-specific integrase [Aurantiacibacter zhengii]RIV85950.1 DUF4102 domain-containing protein [Aurantiacibacter zhengii]